MWLLFLSIFTFLIALYALFRTLTAWIRVGHGYATLYDLAHLTGFLDEDDIMRHFGKPDNCGGIEVSPASVERKQKKQARVYADPVLDGLIVALATIGLLSFNPILMLSAALFVCLWHCVGRTLFA